MLVAVKCGHLSHRRVYERVDHLKPPVQRSQAVLEPRRFKARRPKARRPRARIPCSARRIRVAHSCATCTCMELAARRVHELAKGARGLRQLGQVHRGWTDATGARLDPVRRSGLWLVGMSAHALHVAG